MKKDFIAVADYSADEIREMLNIALDLKKEYSEKGNRPLLAGKVLGMIFNKPSLRTRISFDMAMRHLGGDALFISPAEIGLGQRESIADIARVMAGYVSGIMARVFAHEHVTELARWSSVPVINGLSDYNHPCQAIADIFTIYEHYKRLNDLRVVFIGDGNNVAVSLMHTCALLGLDFSIASPEGYDMDEQAWNLGKDLADASGSSIIHTRDPHAAVKNADVIYTDTWTSMGQEEEAEKRKKVFPPYQVNAELVKEANDSVIIMHCLPAHRGYEINDEVADGPHSVIFQQAHNRLHAQKAILVKVLI